MKKYILILTTVLALGCASRECPPGKVFVPTEDILSATRVLALAAVYDSGRARDCKRAELAHEFDEIALQLVDIHNLLKEKGKYDDERFVNLSLRLVDSHRFLRKKCPVSTPSST